MITDSIPQIFHNCLTVKNIDGEFFPLRFSDSLLAYYDSIDKGTSIRAHSCAGITMDFFTTDDEFSFCYKAHAFCRSMMVFDFFEDGVFLGSIREPDESPSGTITYRKVKKGKVRITIYLPYCAQISFSSFRLSNFEPVPNSKIRFLFLGDSITQGMTVLHPSQSYPLLLSSLFQAAWINQGVGGFVYDKNTLLDIPFLLPDHIFVAYGTNDYTRLKNGRISKEAFQIHVKEYMERLHHISKQIPVTILTPLWRADCPLPQDDPLFSYVTKEIEETGREEGFSILPGLSLVGHDNDFYADGLHPNDHGASMMALHILKQMNEENLSL